MNPEAGKTEEQRGKRKTARVVGLLVILLILASLLDITNAFKVLELILPYAIFLIVSLLGIDAHYNPKRL